MDQKRRDYLVKRDLLVSIDTLALCPPRYVVVTGFGYGVEYWAVADANYDYDAPRYDSKFIVNGKCIDIDEPNGAIGKIKSVLGSEVLYESVD
jgi:hypothetical protein